MVLDFFSRLFNRNKFFTGLLEDNRLESEKQRDHLHEERAVATAPEDPFGNAQIHDSPYMYFNQFSTYSCVAHAVGLALSIEREADTGIWQQISPAFDYRLRSNFPQEGSALPDIALKYRRLGTPLYSTLPTPQTEVELNRVAITDYMYNEAKIFQGGNFISFLFPADINELARVAQLGHGVAILIFMNEDEYNVEYPAMKNPNMTKEQAEIRHCVCILPRSGFTKDGVRYVTIQDSAWFGGWKLHHLSEAFIAKRCYGALYWDTVTVIGGGAYPKWTFNTILRYGMNSGEVEKLQELLIAEGLLAKGFNSGYFGGMTLAAVNAFQSRYASEILIPQGLTQPTGVFGNACMAKANKLCA